MSEHGSGSGLRVALTFDAEHPDRPSWRPDVHDRTVRFLHDAGVPATFFLQGRWVEANPSAARRLADAGFLIGNHSFYHARMPLLTGAGIRADVEAAERAIVSATGTDPRPWFRCPFGAGADDPRVVGALATLGYGVIGWDVEPEEWRSGRTGDDVERFVVSRVAARGDGAVVLLHTWPEATLAALPGIVAGLRTQGATFLTVAELVGDRRREPDHGNSRVDARRVGEAVASVDTREEGQWPPSSSTM